MLPGIGVFGTGAVAKVLVPLLREKGFQINAIWGRTLKDAEETAREQQIPFFTNKIDDVLLKKEVDLVFIICQPFLHSEISVKALGIGKHVVCDKPMGLSQADAVKMVRASQYYPTLITLVNHSLRFLPAVTHLRRALHDEIIGPIRDITLIEVRVQMGSLFPDTFDWMCDAAMGGGVLSLVGSHVVDLVSFLLSQRAIRVHGLVKAFTKTTPKVNGIRQISAPDFCNFQMELEGGTLVTATLHSHMMASKSFMQEVMVFGKNGHLVVRGGDLFVLRRSKDESQQVREEAIYVDVQDLHFSTTDTQLPRPYIKGLCKMVGALKEAFTQKDSSWAKEHVQAAATFEDGLYVQAVLEAIRKSSDSRTWQRVVISSDSPTNHDKMMRFARMAAM